MPRVIVALALLVMLAAAPLAARADLYRWVDPASGSVKYSNYAPAAPAGAEVLTYRGPAGAAPAAAEGLEERRRVLLRAIAEPPAGDSRSPGTALRRQMQDYQALSEELDRLDPAGAARRRAEEAGILEKMRRGLEALRR